MSNHFLQVLKNRHFIKLWLSQILSQFAINVLNFMLIARIYEQTRSSIAVSFLWISYALPAIFFLPLAGPMVDVVSRKKILLFTNILQGLTVLIFLAIGHEIYAIFPIVFLYSALNQFYVPAETASIPDLISEKHLSSANSLFFITTQATFILGFGAGGLLLSLFGAKFLFIGSSAMLFIAAIAVAFLPDRIVVRNKLSTSFTNFWQEFFKGYSFLKNEPGILFPIILLVSGNMLLSVLAAIFPVLGQDLLGQSIRQTGLSVIIPAGLGAFLGSLLIPKLTIKLRKRFIVETGMGLLITSLLCLALIVPISAIVFPTISLIRLFVGAPLIFIMGFSGIIIFIPSQTAVQERTPNILRGRILGVSWFLMTVASIFPLIFAGAITDYLGINSMLSIMAIFVAVALFYSRKLGDSYIQKSSHDK